MNENRNLNYALEYQRDKIRMLQENLVDIDCMTSNSIETSGDIHDKINPDIDSGKVLKEKHYVKSEPVCETKTELQPNITTDTDSKKCINKHRTDY